MARKLFVNLPVKDLKATIAFFTALGFSFNAKFTDDTATCILVGEDAYVMLLTEARFKDFTKRPLSVAHTSTETIVALSADSRAEVDRLAEIALVSGATVAMPPSDLGFMYSRSFYDLDGHHWEVFYMDPAVANA